MPLILPPYMIKEACLESLELTSTPLPVTSFAWVILPLPAPLPLQSQSVKDEPAVAVGVTVMTPSKVPLSEVFVMLCPFRQRLTVPLMVMSYFTLIFSPR